MAAHNSKWDLPLVHIENVIHISRLCKTFLKVSFFVTFIISLLARSDSYLHFRTDEEFRNDFVRILKSGTDFKEYNFECHPMTPATYENQKFEFILMEYESKLDANHS